MHQQPRRHLWELFTWSVLREVKPLWAYEQACLSYSVQGEPVRRWHCLFLYFYFYYLYIIVFVPSLHGTLEGELWWLGAPKKHYQLKKMVNKRTMKVKLPLRHPLLPLRSKVQIPFVVLKKRTMKDGKEYPCNTFQREKDNLISTNTFIFGPVSMSNMCRPGYFCTRTICCLCTFFILMS